MRQLSELLRDARRGRVVGLVLAAQYEDGDVVYSGSGSMCKQPLIGVAATQHLQKILLGEQESV